MRSIAGYVRRHHIGLLALFIALGGTAYAVQVAPKNSVVSGSIKDGQVKQRDVRLTKTAEYPAQVSLGPQQAESLDPVKVKVPKSGLVSVYAETELRKTSGQALNPCSVLLSTDGGDSSTILYKRTSTGQSFSLKRTAPGTDAEGVFFATEAGLITFNLDPGKAQFVMSYNSFTDTNCAFRNTKLVIVPLP